MMTLKLVTLWVDHSEKFYKRVWNVALLNAPQTSHHACTNYFIVNRIYSKNSQS